MDSMTDKTAVFYSDESPDGLKRAICEFESRSFVTDELITRAQVFSEEAFVRGFQAILQKSLGA